MSKQAISTIREKSRIIDRIIEALASRYGFLLLGHQSPDEDCIASMTAFALLAAKFTKRAHVYLGRPVHEHFQYLVNICTYNSIPVLYQGDPISGPVDTVVLFDTAKPSMIEADERILALAASPEVLRIEVDHHLGSDSEYFGDKDYRLVTEASSSGELVGHLLLKLRERRELLRRFQIYDLISRNVVLAILTGIIGDSKMGLFLKSRREKRYYDIFSNMFNDLLARKTVREGNFANMGEVFQEIQKLSLNEERCFNGFLSHRRLSHRIAYVALDERDMKPFCTSFDPDTVVSVARSVADLLAEESGCLGLVCYYDDPALSDLVQFRVRRSQQFKGFDLRRILEIFSIENGGGHEGAIGFRLPRSRVGDLEGYVAHLIDGIEAALEA
jgi:nanoRNase/pAp phosphatase (c-di-AMP/oligoRNAs hydrolase)